MFLFINLVSTQMAHTAHHTILNLLYLGLSLCAWSFSLHSLVLVSNSHPSPKQKKYGMFAKNVMVIIIDMTVFLWKKNYEKCLWNKKACWIVLTEKIIHCINSACILMPLFRACIFRGWNFLPEFTSKIFNLFKNTCNIGQSIFSFFYFTL